MIRTRPCLIDTQRPRSKRGPLQAVDCGLGLGGVWHLDKAKAPRTAGVAVGHHADSRYGPIDTAAMRVHADLPGEYFLSVPMARELATWARSKHLITRQAAHRLVERAEAVLLHHDPSTVVTLMPHMLGEPPRLQPAVLSTEIFAWLYLAQPELAPDEVLVFAIPAALALLDG